MTALLLAVLLPQAGSPRCVIVQIPGNAKAELPVANLVAQEMSGAGRLEPIVLSLTDPVFREAVYAGRIKDRPVWDRRAAVEAAGVLGAEWVAEVKVDRYGTALKGIVVLVHRGRPGWTDSLAISTEGNAGGEPAALESIARTWVAHMMEGPFKTATKVTVQPPTVDPPVTAPILVLPPAPAPPDDEGVRKTVDALLADGKLGQALATARDAVDQQPLSSGRRSLLVTLLMRSGEPETAAREARRAATLIPEKPGLRLDAARAWIAAGRLDEAKADLNEALARGAGSEAQTLVADLALRQNRPDAALRAADAALKDGPSPEALLSRAIARALLGGADGVTQDLAVLTGLRASPEEVVARHRRVVTVLDPAAGRLGDEVRTLVGRAAVRREDPAVLDALDALARTTAGRVSLLAGLAPPAVDPPAPTAERDARRLLAHRLFAQTLEELRAWVKTGDEDALRDARIDLGEALNALKADPA